MKYSTGLYISQASYDTIIPNSSYHPEEWKRAGITYLINKMNGYSINKNEKEKELEIFLKRDVTVSC
jgi:hypothetical protein